jgi:hypothetical protein
MSETGIEKPSTPGLIGDAIRQATSLVSAELQLARLEVTEKLIAAVLAIVSLVMAAVLIIVAMIFLLQGVVELLVRFGWPAFGASFAVGGAIALLAIIAILLSVSRLTAAKLKPSRTMRQVAGATEIVKGTSA